MENSSETAKPTSDKLAKVLSRVICVFIVSGIIWIPVGLYFVNSYFAKRYLLKYAHEQLVSQNYTEINLTVKEFHSGNKSRPRTGKLDFVARNTQGVTFEGTAEVTDERHWLIFHNNGFRIIEIHQKI